jgi:pyrophosphatase PpaX
MDGFAAVLFDMDGTLIYSKGVISRCLNETLAHFGHEPFDPTEIYNLVGKPLREVLAMKTNDWQPMVSHYRQLYLDTYLDGTHLHDGMVSILSMLKDEGKKIGVVTLKQTHVAQEVLRGFKIHEYMDSVEGDDDASPLKPSPLQIIRACQAMNVKPEESVMIGDSAMDIVAGKDAQSITIGVLWGSASMDVLSDAQADFLARNPGELSELLKKL